MDSSNGYTVTKSSALGRTNIYAMTFGPDGSISHAVTGPDNLTKFGSTSLASISYDAPGNPRDALGRAAQRAEVVSGAETDFDYHYDSRNRLSDVFIAGTLSEHYEYDGNGNRLSVTTSSATTSATYDAQDRLLTYGTLSFTYDANGDLETKTDSATNAQTLYSYDALGNLLSVSLPNGTLIEYLVDGQNRRVGKEGQRHARETVAVRRSAAADRGA